MSPNIYPDFQPISGQGPQDRWGRLRPFGRAVGALRRGGGVSGAPSEAVESAGPLPRGWRGVRDRVRGVRAFRAKGPGVDPDSEVGLPTEPPPLSDDATGGKPGRPPSSSDDDDTGGKPGSVTSSSDDDDTTGGKPGRPPADDDDDDSSVASDFDDDDDDELDPDPTEPQQEAPASGAQLAGQTLSSPAGQTTASPGPVAPRRGGIKGKIDKVRGLVGKMDRKQLAAIAAAAGLALVAVAGGIYYFRDDLGNLIGLNEEGQEAIPMQQQMMPPDFYGQQAYGPSPAGYPVDQGYGMSALEQEMARRGLALDAGGYYPGAVVDPGYYGDPGYGVGGYEDSYAQIDSAGGYPEQLIPIDGVGGYPEQGVGVAQNVQVAGQGSPAIPVLGGSPDFGAGSPEGWWPED